MTLFIFYTTQCKWRSQHELTCKVIIHLSLSQTLAVVSHEPLSNVPNFPAEIAHTADSTIHVCHQQDVMVWCINSFIDFFFSWWSVEEYGLGVSTLLSISPTACLLSKIISHLRWPPASDSFLGLIKISNWCESMNREVDNPSMYWAASKRVFLEAAVFYLKQGFRLGLGEM